MLFSSIQFLPQMPQRDTFYFPFFFCTHTIPNTIQSKYVCPASFRLKCHYHWGSTQYLLQIICPYLFLIVKAKRPASLRCSNLLHFSFCCPLVNGLIFLLCCLSPRGAEVKMRDAKQQQKRDKMC